MSVAPRQKAKRADFGLKLARRRSENDALTNGRQITFWDVTEKLGFVPGVWDAHLGLRSFSGGRPITPNKSPGVKSPWAAIRLKNGNTLITDEQDILTREVNPNKETVWELRPSDLPEGYRYINTQSVTRLANGNTIICSRGGDGKGSQPVEVTPD